MRSISPSSSQFYKRNVCRHSVFVEWLLILLIYSTISFVDSINFRNYDHLSEKQLTVAGEGTGDGYSNQGILGGFFDSYNAYGYHDEGQSYIEEDGGDYLESEETSFRKKKPHYKRVEHKPPGRTSATKIEDKYIKITRCNGNQDTSMFSVFPIQDGYAQKCKSHGPNPHCARVTLPVNRHTDMHWHLFANVVAKQECYSPYGQHYYHVNGWVSFDYYRSDTIGEGKHSTDVGMNYNSTIVQKSFRYMQNCSELPEGTPDIERYSAQIVDSIPPYPTDGWTDLYYTSNSTERDASDCLKKDFRGYVNIPLDTCLNDPAGWMNLVSYHGLKMFFGEENLSDDQLHSEPNATQTLSPNNSRNDTLYFQYISSSADSSLHQCGVEMQYFRHDDNRCESILKKRWQRVKEDDCGSVLEDDTKELYTLASGKFSRSVATYPATGHCHGSRNYGYDSGYDIYTFHGPCRVVSCFSGTETVQLESGQTVPISLVKVGDRILSADRNRNYRYADVVAIPHRNTVHGYDRPSTRFIVVTTDAGNDLKLSEDHMIWSCSRSNSETCINQWELKKTSSLMVGDFVELMNRATAKIIGLDVIIDDSGYYTVVTQEELIVVNGFIASPFAVNHMIGHYFYNIHRFLYMVIPSVMKSEWFGQLHATSSDMIADLSAS